MYQPSLAIRIQRHSFLLRHSPTSPRCPPPRRPAVTLDVLAQFPQTARGRRERIPADAPPRTKPTPRLFCANPQVTPRRLSIFPKFRDDSPVNSRRQSPPSPSTSPPRHAPRIPARVIKNNGRIMLELIIVAGASDGRLINDASRALIQRRAALTAMRSPTAASRNFCYHALPRARALLCDNASSRARGRLRDCPAVRLSHFCDCERAPARAGLASSKGRAARRGKPLIS